MLFRSDEDQRAWAATIALGAQTATAEQLRTVLELGRRAKPKGYDAVSCGMAERARGDQCGIVSAAISARFPNAGPMPVTPVNWLGFFARSDAGVYVVDATRFLSEGGVKLPAADVVDQKTKTVKEKADPRAAGFARACEDVGLLQLMPELERRALTGVKTAVVEIGWRKLGADDEGRPAAHMYWPHDVVVICHPSAPSDVRAIQICALRQTPTSATHLPDQNGKTVDTWWVWSRDAVDDDDGNVAKFGEWGHCKISSDGKHQTLRKKYPGKLLPIVFVRTEQADGGFFPVPESDVLAQVDELNVARSNEHHIVNLQGHDQIALTGPSTGDIVTGPDRVMVLGPQVTAQVLSYNPKLDQVRMSRQESLREIAVSRSNNPDAYATTPQVAESGVSRKMANIPHDRRIRELRPIFHDFEKQQLLPVLIEVLNDSAPNSYCPPIGPDVVADVVFGAAPDYEELDQKQRRLELDLKMGIISPAQYAVLMGHHDNVAAAVDAGLSDELKAQETPTASTAGGPPMFRPHAGAPMAPPPAEKPAASADGADPPAP